MGIEYIMRVSQQVKDVPKLLIKKDSLWSIINVW